MSGKHLCHTLTFGVNLAIQLALHIHGFCILRFNPLWMENIQKKKKKNPENSKKQNLSLP